MRETQPTQQPPYVEYDESYLGGTPPEEVDETVDDDPIVFGIKSKVASGGYGFAVFCASFEQVTGWRPASVIGLGVVAISTALVYADNPQIFSMDYIFGDLTD